LNIEEATLLIYLLSLLPDIEQKEDLKMTFRIAKLSEKGEVVLQMSEPFKVLDEAVLPKTMEVYLVPSEQNMKLDWSLESIEANQIVLQLSLTKDLLESEDLAIQRLRVEFKVRKLLYSLKFEQFLWNQADEAIVPYFVDESLPEIAVAKQAGFFI